MSTNCVCGSGKNKQNCCLVLIGGKRQAENAEQLMRSRYTAYLLGESEYILNTWHSSTRPLDMCVDDQVVWTGLRVIKHRKASKTSSFVEFMASFDVAGTVDEMHEISRFVLEDGRWFYIDGEQVETIKKIGRNDPCSCGSGKKFKKCCGKN